MKGHTLPCTRMMDHSSSVESKRDQAMHMTVLQCILPGSRIPTEYGLYNYIVN